MHFTDVEIAQEVIQRKVLLLKLYKKLLSMRTCLSAASRVNVFLHFLPLLAILFESFEEPIVFHSGPASVVVSIWWSLGLSLGLGLLSTHNSSGARAGTWWCRCVMPCLSSFALQLSLSLYYWLGHLIKRSSLVERVIIEVWVVVSLWAVLVSSRRGTFGCSRGGSEGLGGTLQRGGWGEAIRLWRVIEHSCVGSFAKEPKKISLLLIIIIADFYDIQIIN